VRFYGLKRFPCCEIMSLMKYLKKKRLSSGELNAVQIEVREQKSKDVIKKEKLHQLDEEEVRKRLATPLNPDDFFKIEDALMQIAEDPPLVARSTPKNLIPNQKSATQRSLTWSEKDMAHCLYERSVYDDMINNSLKTCEELQENLDFYVDEVRKSPSSNFAGKF